MAAANIALGNLDCLYLGNLNAKRDWGFAGDYVEDMWLMLQQEKPDDFVIATGRTTAVRDFVALAFKEIGIDIVWNGSGLEETGADAKTGKILVRVDPRYFRPTEVDLLLGDPSKAYRTLGWKPKVTLEELAHLMVTSDLELARKNKLLLDNHFAIEVHSHD